MKKVITVLMLLFLWQISSVFAESDFNNESTRFNQSVSTNN